MCFKHVDWLNLVREMVSIRYRGYQRRLKHRSIALKRDCETMYPAHLSDVVNMVLNMCCCHAFTQRRSIRLVNDMTTNRYGYSIDNYMPRDAAHSMRTSCESALVIL